MELIYKGLKLGDLKNRIATITPGILTICTYTEFAPFSYEEDGEIVGTDIDFLKNFAAEMNLRVKILKKDFSGLWETPGQGICDVSAAGMMEYQDRILGDSAVWSEPYMLVTRSLLIRSSDRDILKSPEDFRDKKIVVTPTSSAHIDGDIRYKPIGATIIPEVPSQDEIVSQLLSGQIDAFGEGDVSNEYLASRYTDSNGERLLVLTDVHPMEKPELLRFAVRSVDHNLPTRLNEFISKSQKDIND
ncbi:MAG: transporter substrate-binding domain-containing protein [Chloroflexota bacterium]|nr:transporter substrate-binding domain-containing protein [Chloroflexota bacterium]|tara:strand:- start:2435 stop:3172 length:738 start_codon:yes stop_codon:yes gene_type:complete